MIVKRKTKTGEPRYFVRVQVDGHRFTVGTFSNRRDAQKAEAGAKAGGPPPEQMRVGEFVEFWLAGYRERVKDSTYATTESMLRKFVKDFGHRPIRKITPMEAERWARDNRYRVPAVITLLTDATRGVRG